MRRLDLILRVRSITRDFSNSIFRESDIIAFLNEGIDRITQVIPEMTELVYLDFNSDEPKMLPKSYHNLLALYASSRCFSQDERHYQGTNLMNEFESKLDDLKNDVEIGRVKIALSDGTTITTGNPNDFVVDDYYDASGDEYDDDVDTGVDGVE